MNDISPLEDDLGFSINHRRFWFVLSYEETRLHEHGCRKFNPLQIVRLRYWQNGNIAHTYQEIAGVLNSSPEYIRLVCQRGLREMRHPHRKRQFQN